MTKDSQIERCFLQLRQIHKRFGGVHALRGVDLTLELGSAELRCGSDSVQLSRKEFEVARLFLSNPQMTITKETLIINVWGIESEATDNNVEAYISFLRKKLRYLNSSVSIRNIQKIGYRLEVAQC